MTDEEILSQIQQVAIAKVNWQGRLDPAMDLMADLCLDSLRTMELVVGIEEQFGIEFDYAESTHIRTINDLVQSVSAKLDQAKRV